MWRHCCFRESEADRQIREIMGRVMKHATAVLADIGKIMLSFSQP